ncbi:lipid kinase YegS [Pseudomonas matsuisoli]|uniref:Lipid kinase YegS-like protein n=1 Tax=Pseudomonas matsuisoli TaxID=1515666 RepID=A0A917USB4_9PSED|nr:lipid kinase YegS [Pseudomonas matsuisoli]GGJ81460.1 putative lipid kinase YegS-like protein [Pseudomonas matsuisoli]
MNERRALVILHGKQAQNEEVRAAILAKREQGWELAVRTTWEGGDAQRITKEAIDAGYPTVVAGGGDGTLRDVAEALVACGGKASLVLLPLGTANDFAHAADVPLTPAEALELLETPPTPIDVGDMDGHQFLNMATGGFGSRVTASTSEDLKKVLGAGAYLITGLTRFSELRSSFGRFRGPDFCWEGEFLALGIGNGRTAGGGQALCPNALVNDGVFDLCIVPAAQDVVGTFRTLLNGGIHGLDTVSVTARLPWIEIEAPEGLDLNLDGEPHQRTEMHFKVLAGVLRVHLPTTSPLINPSALPTESATTAL